MTEETRELAGDEPPEYAAIRPSGHYLMLLLRAAVADDGHGGPWLYVYRTTTPGGSPIFTHHITTSTIAHETYSESRALMISGDDALAFAAENGWPASSVVDPTVAELRALGTYAVEVEQLDHWRAWHSAWLRGEPRRLKSRAERAERSRAAARPLRWTLAEQWLRQVAE